MFGSVILLLATLIQPVRGGDKISVDPRLSCDGISVGTTIEGAILITVAGGWHINTASPSDENLIATAASFSPPGGLTVAGVRFPRAAARKFAFSETPVEVYEGTFVVRFSLTAAPGTPPGTFLLEVDVSYQACNDDVCLAPSTVHAGIPVRILPPDAAPAAANPDLFGKAGNR